MNSREVSVWLDSRWCDALEKQKGAPMCDIVNDYLDSLINQLPEREYERISAQIHEEQMQLQQEKEAARRYAVFHLVENGEHRYLQVERSLEMLDAARMLRAYRRHSTIADTFGQTIHAAQDITQEQFAAQVHERMENNGKVTGAFELDFDKEQFSALHIMDGWKCYTMKDISTAIFHADRKDYISRAARWERFTDKLMGKELHYEPQEQPVEYIEGTRRLRPDEVMFQDEVMWEHNELEFYVPIYFDPDAVFGTRVATTENDDFINVYAHYDLETQSVRDELTICLSRGDGSEEEFRYKLTAEEQEMFRGKMEAYCSHDGMTLDEYREQYLEEADQAPSQTMQM